MSQHAPRLALVRILVAITLLAPWASAQESAQRPNVLFIMTDDHAYQAISAYGSRVNQTPQIDRLAEQGALFRNCFVTNSICAPSRATILTGRYSHLNGVIDNASCFDGNQTTFPKLLQKAGYQTAVIGKWHLRNDPIGFDHWEVLPGQGSYYNPDLRTAEGRKRYPGYATDIITDHSLEWLRNRDTERPFVLLSWHKAPHRNWQPAPRHLDLYDDVRIPEPPTLFDDYAGRCRAASLQEMTLARHMFPAYDLLLYPPEPGDKTDRRMWKWTWNRLNPEQRAQWDAAYADENAAFRAAKLKGNDLLHWRYQRYVKNYLRCIAAVDENVGRLLDYLDESGLAENTLVIYTSDQGWYLGDHGWYDKRWMYEESLRTPLIIRGPGVKAAAPDREAFASNLDLGPTILDLAGVSVPEEMQGRSLLPLLADETPEDWRQSFYYHYYENPGAHNVHRHCGVRTARYKLIHFYTLGAWELFDLESDPNEMQSVYDDPAYAPVVAELKRELKRLQTEVGETDPQASRASIRQQALMRAARRAAPGAEFRLAGRDDKLTEEPDPSRRPFTVGAICEEVGPKSQGVIAAQGGRARGWSLYLDDGVPVFALREESRTREVRGPALAQKRARILLAGSVDAEGRLSLYLDGRRVAHDRGWILATRANEPLTLGSDPRTPVGRYRSPNAFTGRIRDFRLYLSLPDVATLRQWAAE